MPLSSTSHFVQDLMDQTASISEVLARPFLISDIHLSVPGIPLTSSVSIPLALQNFVSNVSLPSAILADPLKMSKLEYFKYFTADMKIRIETNAQPYMSGNFGFFITLIPI